MIASQVYISASVLQKRSSIGLCLRASTSAKRQLGVSRVVDLFLCGQSAATANSNYPLEDSLAVLLGVFLIFAKLVTFLLRGSLARAE